MFTVGVVQDVDSLNPFIGVTVAAYEMFQMQYPTLTEWDAKNFAVVPGLAESWKESPDKTFWTYKIRPDLKWSDGEPLTAKDAAYTFNRIINGTFEKTNFGNYVSNITKAEAPDDTTLILRVDKPTPIMQTLVVYILPEHVYSKIDEAAIQSYNNEPVGGKPTVGAGPYLVAERKVGEFTRLVCQSQLLPRQARRRRGRLQALLESRRTGPGAEEGRDRLRRQPGGECLRLPYRRAEHRTQVGGLPGIQRAGVQHRGRAGGQQADRRWQPTAEGQAPARGDRLVAGPKDDGGQGLRWARDRRQRPSSRRCSRTGTSHRPTRSATTRRRPSSCWMPRATSVGPDGIRRAENGARLDFRLFGRSDSPTSKKAVEYIKRYLADVGIAANVSLISEDALTEKIGQGEFDMFEWGWVVEPDPNYQLSTMTCGSRSYEDGGSVLAGLSDSFYCNPKYDELFAAQGSETDHGQARRRSSSRCSRSSTTTGLTR